MIWGPKGDILRDREICWQTNSEGGRPKWYTVTVAVVWLTVSRNSSWKISHVSSWGKWETRATVRRGKTVDGRFVLRLIGCCVALDKRAGRRSKLTKIELIAGDMIIISIFYWNVWMGFRWNRLSVECRTRLSETIDRVAARVKLSMAFVSIEVQLNWTSRWGKTIVTSCIGERTERGNRSGIDPEVHHYNKTIRLQEAKTANYRYIFPFKCPRLQSVIPPASTTASQLLIILIMPESSAVTWRKVVVVQF